MNPEQYRKSVEKLSAEDPVLPATPVERVPYVPFDPARHIVRTRPNGRPKLDREESQKAHYAFLLYCALGPKLRTYQRVLHILVAEDKLGPHSLRQIDRWAKKYCWFERAKEYDASVMEKEREENDATRLSRLLARADAAGNVYDEAITLALAKLQDAQSGKAKIPFEAVVALIKNVADIEYRDRNDLADFRPAQATAQTGIQIVIDSYGGPAPTGAALAQPLRVTALPAPSETAPPEGAVREEGDAP